MLRVERKGKKVYPASAKKYPKGSKINPWQKGDSLMTHGAKGSWRVVEPELLCRVVDVYFGDTKSHVRYKVAFHDCSTKWLPPKYLKEATLLPNARVITRASDQCEAGLRGVVVERRHEYDAEKTTMYRVGLDGDDGHSVWLAVDELEAI